MCLASTSMIEDLTMEVKAMKAVKAVKVMRKERKRKKKKKANNAKLHGQTQQSMITTQGGGMESMLPPRPISILKMQLKRKR